MDSVVLTDLKLKEHLLLPDLSKVELVLIRGLQDLVHAKLRWPLLQMSALVQLCNKSILPGNHLQVVITENLSGKLPHPLKTIEYSTKTTINQNANFVTDKKTDLSFTSSDIVAKKPSLHSILPLYHQEHQLQTIVS